MAKIEPVEFLTKNGSTVVFRNIEGKDAERLLAFRQQIAIESTNTMQYQGQEYPTVEQTANRLDSQLDDKSILNLGVFDGDTLVGYLNFRRPWDDHPWAKHIAQFGMMILKSYWGQGIGKRMLQIQEAHAGNIGAQRIEAMVRFSNDRAIKLYERSGYSIEGVRKKAAIINNVFVDEYFIAKILNDSLETWKPPVIETF